MIEYFVDVAKECINIGNFNSLMAIIGKLIVVCHLRHSVDFSISVQLFAFRNIDRTLIFVLLTAQCSVLLGNDLC